MLRRLFLDPLAIKELSGSARRWQTYAGRGLHVALFAAVVWSYVDLFSRYPVWRSRSDYAELAKRLFQAFFFLQMGVATLASVSAASDLVTKELRAGTLSILICSPLTPGGIAFGKWKAAFAQAGTLILCGAPVFAFCVYLGGATPWDLAYSLSLSFASIGLGAATGLYFSTRFRSGVTALLVSIGALSAYAFFPAFYMDRYANSLLGALTHFTHLLDAADVATRSTRVAYGQSEWGWVSAVVVTALIVWLLLRRAAARIATLALATPGPSFLSRLFAALDRFYEDISPERLRGIRLIPGGDGVWDSRAVLWKELQTRASGRLRNNVRISLALLLLLAATFWITFDLMAVPVAVTTLMLWFLALSNGASLFVTEKEERKWDILLATPLRSAQILSAKLLAGMVPVLPTVVTIVLFWAAIHFTHRLSESELLIAWEAIFLPAGLAYALGALCSLKARSLRAAFLSAFSILAGLMVVLPFLMALSRTSSLDASAWYSPLPPLYWVCEHALSYWPRSVSERMTSNCQVFAGVYSAAIAAIVVTLFAKFDGIAGRSA